ncbi:MAG: hypothetical protein EOO10_00995 [Chitinophagaceae bacterium]|nr:MAG: hypothetical protein EOO10_00995 [Chitinophagaceae bacterium]
MKKVIFNLMAAVIIGFVCYGIFTWLVGWKQKDALVLGISVAFSGFVVECLKPLLTKKKTANLAE